MRPYWSWSFRLLFLASLLLLSSASPSPPPPRGCGSPQEVAAEAALLARMCDPRSPRPAAVPLSWCHELHLRRRRGAGLHHHHHRHHHRPVPVPVPMPPPGRDDGEEVDPRYGVAKRLVPTGPNPLHN